MGGYATRFLCHVRALLCTSYTLITRDGRITRGLQRQVREKNRSHSLCACFVFVSRHVFRRLPVEDITRLRTPQALLCWSSALGVRSTRCLVNFTRRTDQIPDFVMI